MLSCSSDFVNQFSEYDLQIFAIYKPNYIVLKKFFLVTV